MPSRNVIKEYAPYSYYHVYNRGVAKQLIFTDDSDFVVFLSLFKRHLSKETQTDRYGREQPNYHAKIELLGFCLMPNHFHMLLYQCEETQTITKFLQSVCTSYTMYFNRKHKRVGPLFQSRFKASRIINDEYLQHISRYIHLNPSNYKTYRWSSLPYYTGKLQAEWLSPRRILELFKSEDYQAFLNDYKAYKDSLDEIKHELANKL